MGPTRPPPSSQRKPPPSPQGCAGEIIVPPGVYFTDPFTLNSTGYGHKWRGYGPRTSVLKCRPSASDFVTNTQSGTGQQSTLIEGIGFDATMTTGTARGFVWGDTGGTGALASIGMRDCWVYGAAGDGIDTTTAGGTADECYFVHVFSYRNQGIGWVLGSDQRLFGCVAAFSGTIGFKSSASAWQMVNCKAYNNGTVTATSGFGFQLTGTVSGSTMVGCEAQDNKASGPRDHLSIRLHRHRPCLRLELAARLRPLDRRAVVRRDPQPCRLDLD
jgi:hypothetical protein